jgi:hypothetical protein
MPERHDLEYDPVKHPSDAFAHESNKTDRPTGLFTERQRRYLYDPAEFTEEEQQSLDSGVKAQIHQGLLDLSLLQRMWKGMDLWEETVNAKPDLPPSELIKLFTRMSHATSQYATEEMHEIHRTETPIEFFEEMIERVLWVYSVPSGDDDTYRSDVEVSIEIEYEDFDEEEIFERLISADATPEELLAYQDMGDRDRLIAHLQGSDEPISVYHPEKGAYEVVTANGEYFAHKFIKEENSHPNE